MDTAHRTVNARLVGLEEADLSRVEEVGMKAGRLGALLRLGLPVPDGRIVPPAVAATDEGRRAAATAIVAELGDGPFAVRSSAVVEDLADASFAGLYATVVDVRGEAGLVEAIATVAGSATAERVASYAGGTETSPIAVLVQRLVPADRAGVALTANPLTGARGEVVVSAVAGLGEQLVDGSATSEDWIVDADGARSNGPEPVVLGPAAAEAVAALARRVEEIEGSPQDIEWAMVDGEVLLLQARPMTALVDEVDWATDVKNPFLLRSFRLGEWLGDPVTPLFETWYLPAHDDGFAAAQREGFGGGTVAPFHAVVNGWYYAGIGTPSASVLGAMVRHPVHLAGWGMAFQGTGRRPRLGERFMGGPGVQHHREVALPGYQASIDAAEAEVDSAEPARLLELVDAVAHASGSVQLSIAEGAGFGWKAEAALCRLCREQVGLDEDYTVLLAGLAAPRPVPAHAVSTLDWSQPTAGEGEVPATGSDGGRHERLVADRQALEARCRSVLADRPRQARRFEAFLDIAQRFALVREEIVADLTLGWPVMRRGLQRLGNALVADGVLDDVDDVFWLTKAQLDAAVAGDTTDLRISVVDQRALWDRRRRLRPPDAVGKPSKAVERARRRHGAVEGSADGALVTGVGASPGRATGPVRVITAPEQFDRVRAGDVLVARLTAPAWTPLFAHVAAVVTDSGSVAAHASLIAREYGLPAVVGTGDATSVLRDGQLVTVDGSAGVVLPA